MTLRGLDRDAVSGVAAELAGGHPGPGLLAQVQRAMGNPLFIGELIGSLRDEGVLDVVDGQAEVADGGVAPTLRLTILRRLSVLSDETLDVLRLASILGRSFTVANLSVVVRRSVLELLPALDEAVSAGVLGEAGDHLAFRHDLIREAVYEDLPLAVRKGLHRDAGRALADAAAPLSAVAAQLVLGASAGDREAAAWLRRAGQEAALRSPGVAVELLERALALLADDTAETRRRRRRDGAVADPGRAGRRGGGLGPPVPDPGADPGSRDWAAPGVGRGVLGRWSPGGGRGGAGGGSRRRRGASR